MAYALSLNYAGEPTGIVEYLYNGGFGLDAITYALAPPRIAYDSDTVPAGEYRGVPDGQRPHPGDRLGQHHGPLIRPRTPACLL